MKKALGTIAMATCLAFSSVTLARPDGPRDADAEFLLRERVAEKLELSDAQKSEISRLTEEFKLLYPRDKEAREAHHAALKAIMEADSFDEIAAQELLDAGDEKKLAALRLRFDINNVLTDEQQAKLEQMRERMRDRKKDKGFRH